MWNLIFPGSAANDPTLLRLLIFIGMIAFALIGDRLIRRYKESNGKMGTGSIVTMYVSWILAFYLVYRFFIHYLK